MRTPAELLQDFTAKLRPRSLPKEEWKPIGCWLNEEQIAAIQSDAQAELQRENAELRKAVEKLWPLLKEIENHCPCGARPESPNTHPHVIDCPVELALNLTKSLRGGGK